MPLISPLMPVSQLWKSLKDMGLCVTMVDTLKRLYQQQQAAVRVKSEIQN